MTFKLHIAKNNVIDISDDIKDNIEYTQRNDHAFSNGKCTMVTSNTYLSYNIAPYTLCELNGIKLVCESTCHEYLTKQANNVKNYVHDMVLYEPTALLETLDLGVKTFSDTTDIDAVEIIRTLMENKYSGYDFIIEQSITTALGNASHDYTFGAGTTMFAALTEIGKRNNIRFYVRTFDWSNIDNTKVRLWLSCYSTLESAYTNLVTFSETDVLSSSISQESNNYCKSLETIQNNVVDRSNKTRWNDMTCRNLECAMNADNAVILLPTNVEYIEKIFVNGDYSYGLDFSHMQDILTVDVFMQHGSVYAGGFRMTPTYNNLISWNIPYNGISNIFQYLYDNYISPFFTTFNLNTQIPIEYHTATHEIVTDYAFIGTKENYYYDYSEFLLEETEWNAKPANEKSKYMVYKKNGNTIYNLNATYQENFWGVILGYSTGNFLEEQRVYDTLNLDTDNYLILVGHSRSTNPLNVSYSIEGYPIVNNLILIDEKKDTPVNESYYKTMTRTYQNSASTIEFDSLVKDVKAQNKVLGVPDLTLETEKNSIEEPGLKKIIYRFRTWFINAMTYVITPTHMSCIINASAKPHRIADAIGVDYQFNPVQLPIENVMVRPLYFEVNSTTDWNRFKTYYDNKRDIFLSMTLLTPDYSTREIDLTLRTVTYQDDEGNFYVYASMLDNYSAGKKAMYKAVNTYEVKDVPYVDSNYQAEGIDDMWIVLMDQRLSADFERKLPDISYDDDIDIPSVSSAGIEVDFSQYRDYLFKDSRETLAFVIKVSKSN